MPDFLSSVPLLARVRRNHALEHATIHVLSQRQRNLRVVGRSTWNGFALYGDLTAEQVAQAAQDALQRLQSGQRELAIHPNCGTNLVTSGTLAGLGAFAVLTPRRRSLREWLGRLPLVVVLATAGVMLGQRLGLLLQARVTTDAEVSGLRITGILREERGVMLVHHVRTEG